MYKKERYKNSYGMTKKYVALLVSLALVICVTVGGVIAFLVDKTVDVNNTFTPSEVTTEVTETIGDDVKSDVMIKNTGDTTAWIRAAVVVTWQDSNGNVYSVLPVKDKDYTIEYNLASTDKGQWIEGADGFYYWSKPVKSDDEDANDCLTGVLIKECKYIKNAPDGYHLAVEIIGSGIQADGKSFSAETGLADGKDQPVEIAWSSDKVTVTVNDDGTLSVIKKTN